jgi:signal transduction histidine kinase
MGDNGRAMAPSARAADSPSERAVDELIARTASANERLLAVLRLLFVSGNALRSLWVWGAPGYTRLPGQVAMLVLLGGGALIFSLVVLLGFRGRSLPRPIFAIAVVVDAVICFAALFDGAFWPGPGWPGIVLVPDTAALLVVTAAAGLRLSVPVAVLGGLLNGLSFAILIQVDAARGGPAVASQGDRVVFWLMLIVFAAALAVTVAWLGQRLALTAARRAVEAERARHGLDALLEDHHDVRTLLSSAALEVDFLVRSLSGARTTRPAEVVEAARALRRDLLQVNEFVAGIRERAWGERSAVQDPVVVDVARVVGAVAGDLSSRFDATVCVHTERSDARAVVAGGEPVLRRIFLNLIVNACEGDGAGRARRVEIRLETLPDPDRLRVVVADDGPGFPAPVLGRAIEERVTTKPGGSGLGLLLVETLLGGQAATLRRANRARGGAAVSFELPLAG